MWFLKFTKKIKSQFVFTIKKIQSFLFPRIIIEDGGSRHRWVQKK
jgi:hypothetical protein